MIYLTFTIIRFLSQITFELNFHTGNPISKSNNETLPKNKPKQGVQSVVAGVNEKSGAVTHNLPSNRLSLDNNFEERESLFNEIGAQSHKQIYNATLEVLSKYSFLSYFCK